MTPLDPADVPAELTKPISASSPCGDPIRYDRVYRQIQDMREADDPTLPQGDWERPLKRADWRQVAFRCQQVLSTRTKDLQVAAWLTEAWTHQHGLSGFNAGIDVILKLCEQFWRDLHPQIDDEESITRSAPFVWLNENLSQTLQQSVVLIHAAQVGVAVTLVDWQLALRHDNLERRTKHGDSQAMGRLDLLALAANVPTPLFRDRIREAAAAREIVAALSAQLDDKLGNAGPSLGRLRETLTSLHMTLLDIARDSHHVINEPEPEQPAPEPEITSEPGPSTEPTEAIMPEERITPAPDAVSGPIQSREDAYRRLAEAAEYLQRTEPHSPTPYLVQRAVMWGRMSLADLVQELLKDESDLGRLYSMLGLNGQRPHS